MAVIQYQRLTRAQIDQAASDGMLVVGGLYLISDDWVLAYGISANAYRTLAKKGS